MPVNVNIYKAVNLINTKYSLKENLGACDTCVLNNSD